MKDSVSSGVQPLVEQEPVPSAAESLQTPSARSGEVAQNPVTNQAGPSLVPQDMPLSTPVHAAHRLYRHSLPVRLAHWLNVICLPILIMSGLQIFNAHPALYWGDRSDRDRPILAMRAIKTERGEGKGVTTVFGHSLETTGILGFSADSARGFPGWATLPSGKWLAMGRQWHLFFAWIFVVNGLLFGLYAVLSRHLWRDLLPKLKDLRGIGRDIRSHITFRHPTGEEARHYNVLQKLAYTGVVFVVGPLIVLTGLSMSPTIDAGFPGLLSLLGGRQSARTIHFLACFAFIGFVTVHLLMVATTGLRNNLRSMITGWFNIREGGEAHDDQVSQPSGN